MNVYLLSSMMFSILGAITGTDLEDSMDSAAEKIQQLVDVVVPWVFGIIGMLAVLWIVYIGIKYIMANSADKRKEAKELLKQLLIGVAILFVLAAISGIVIAGLYGWYTTA